MTSLNLKKVAQFVAFAGIPLLIIILIAASSTSENSNTDRIAELSGNTRERLVETNNDSLSAVLREMNFGEIDQEFEPQVTIGDVTVSDSIKAQIQVKASEEVSILGYISANSPQSAQISPELVLEERLTETNEEGAFDISFPTRFFENGEYVISIVAIDSQSDSIATFDSSPFLVSNQTAQREAPVRSESNYEGEINIRNLSLEGDTLSGVITASSNTDSMINAFLREPELKPIHEVSIRVLSEQVTGDGTTRSFPFSIKFSEIETRSYVISASLRDLNSLDSVTEVSELIFIEAPISEDLFFEELNVENAISGSIKVRASQDTVLNVFLTNVETGEVLTYLISNQAVPARAEYSTFSFSESYNNLDGNQFQITANILGLWVDSGIFTRSGESIESSDYEAEIEVNELNISDRVTGEIAIRANKDSLVSIYLVDTRTRQTQLFTNIKYLVDNSEMNASTSFELFRLNESLADLPSDRYDLKVRVADRTSLEYEELIIDTFFL